MAPLFYEIRCQFMRGFESKNVNSAKKPVVFDMIYIDGLFCTCAISSIIYHKWFNDVIFNLINDSRGIFRIETPADTYKNFLSILCKIYRYYVISVDLLWKLEGHERSTRTKMGRRTIICVNSLKHRRSIMGEI